MQDPLSDTLQPPWQRLTTLLQWLMWVLLAMVLLRTAWVCDDAYITMRCVDNAVRGLGFTFNPVERVQAFTHPLWAMLLLPVHAVFGSSFWEMLALSFGCSLAAMLVVARQIKTRWAWLALPLLAISSKALIEYCSSGLENPLSFLLLALFVAQWWRWQTDRGSVLKLALIAALVLLNRMDMLLLIGPALGVTLWRERSWRTLGMVALGLLPFLLWELFATFYYGFPFPNTAYAKLATRIPFDQLLELSIGYYRDSLHRDWVTLPLIMLALALGMLRGKQWPLALGIVLYLLYILRIGGDFMSGRFFAAPFLMGLMIVCHVVRDDWRKWPALVLPVFALGLLSPTPMLLSGRDYSVTDFELIGPTGVADERSFYYQESGLLVGLDGGAIPRTIKANEGRKLQSGGPTTRLEFAIGMYSYFAGPQVHVIDRYGLSDPLMSRIPAIYSSRPRSGHYNRRIPKGYSESVSTGKNQITDADLAALYDQIKLITQGPLFSSARLAAIWQANTSRFPKADLSRFRVPMDHTLRVGRNTAPPMYIYDYNSWHVFLPAGARRLQFMHLSTFFFDVVWLKGLEPRGIERIERLQQYDLEIPKGVDGFVMLREGSSNKCLVNNLVVK